ncbi:MAG: hypothetical protein V1688_02215 [bacterium]
MFKKIYYQIISRFPSEGGQKATDELMDVLSHGGIKIDIRFVQDESGAYYLAKSTDLPTKRIITTGKTLAELDTNIRDAIFGIFQVPPYYCKQVSINIPNLTEKISLQYAAV